LLWARSEQATVVAERRVDAMDQALEVLRLRCRCRTPSAARSRIDALLERLPATGQAGGGSD
jgi:hypothetical protein